MFGIGWFSSGRDKAARDLLATVHHNIKKGEIKALITFVFSNREPGESAESDSFFSLVKEYHLPLVCFSSRKFRQARGKPFDECRIDYDREVMKRIEPFFQNLSVLAGYMLIAGPELCQKYKMINLHPAAPGGPAGTWQEVVWQLIESRAKSSGVMMHRVTPELDRGPVAGYCTYPITGGLFDRGWKEVDDRGIEEVKRLQGENNYLFRLIRREGLAREFPLIVATIKALAEGSIKVLGDGIVDAAGRVSGGYDLTGEIEAGLLEKPPLQTGEDNT